MQTVVNIPPLYALAQIVIDRFIIEKENMKNKFYLVISLLFVSHALAAQNNNCENPQFICFNNNTVVVEDDYNYSIPGSSLCNPDPLKLYYFFETTSIGASSLLQISCATGMSGYRLYGPFTTPLSNACVAIASGPPSSSSTTPSTFYTPVSLSSTAFGTYYLEVSVDACSGLVSIGKNGTAQYNCNDGELPCENCIGSFAPKAGETYLLSAWVKEGSAPLSKTSFNFPSIDLVFTDLSPSSVTTLGPYVASGQIIDGWQRVEQEFTIPTGSDVMDIKLNCTSGSGDCYFDDIRIFPYDGSMKSYVYDPVTLRLVAELDERNYATMYEYDEEGKLVRIKKETERGIMTIQESKTNVVKK
jgi:hypothetical protein